jgi:tRNA-binding EMAP/Myf-like protein
VDQLLGNNVLVVANVEPRKLLGQTSDGMILAAFGVAGPTPIMPSEHQEQGVLD